MKICKNCNKEFTPVHESRGQEQVYCSIKCRQTSAHLRSINKIKQSVIQENEKETEAIQENVGYRRKDILSRQEWENARNTTGGLVISDNYISIIKELYEAKNETIFYKLKNEQLEKELSELKIELYNLEQELENEGEEESGYSGMLGSVMQQFKEDPVNTINFASELIGNLFKPKKNETTIKS